MGGWTGATHINRLRIWTISNLLSVARVLLIPPIYHFLWRGRGADNVIAVSLMLVAAMSDVLDGIIARRTGVESSLGKILDPLADKICIGAMIILLVTLRGFPVWLVVVVIGRDLLIIVAGSLLVGNRKVVLSSNWLGKVTTHFMALLILSYTLRWEWAYSYLIAGGLFFLIASTTSYGVAMHHVLFSRDDTTSAG